MLRQTAFAVFVLTLVSGCGNGLEVQKITGRVLLEGQPIPDVAVTFLPRDTLEQGTITAGVTDEEGRFVELPDPKWSQGRAGNYGVMLMDKRMSLAMVMMAISTGGKKFDPMTPPMLPLKYQLVEHTPLEIVIERGTNDLGDLDVPDGDNVEVVKELAKRKHRP